MRTSCHQEAELLLSGVLRIDAGYNVSFKNNGDSVTEIHNFIKLKREEKNGFSGITPLNKLFMDKFNRSDIKTAGRLGAD
ncbi:hypothetical protein KQR57_17075 [Bacillus inaquosorum]|nr:hypothetical protein [Bacillus inaquosorum]